MGLRGFPPRRKYACSECTRRSEGTVRPAAINAWAATWPPNTRTGDAAGDPSIQVVFQLLQIE